MSNNPATTTSTAHYLQRAYALSGTSETETQTFYDEWAETYDSGLNAGGYASPRRAAEAIVRNIHITGGAEKLRILDAGCGTGLVGEYLSRSSLSGKFDLTGLDLSPGMLAVARQKGMYRMLQTADLNQLLASDFGVYDVVVCVGVLTRGHVGPRVLGDFVALTTPGGLIVATVLEEVWGSGGYRDEVEKLRSSGAVEVVSLDRFGILEGEESGGRMVVLKRIEL
ncbi:class I SAM-dependent DNA methyltransferase [Aspergillus lucknowensis]|uniref:S-adenosyl-L-methionine-dependent methyltransferase n=1 Tax=Aspergillus lucknowensis TaxID=176173 RepID=A0ABR4LDT2_9EURO